MNADASRTCMCLPVDADFEIDENGNYRLPARNVQAVKDYIVVDR